MKAIILAAGEGKRLHPLTRAIPKPLLPVAGVPVIDYVIANLARCHEIDEIYIAISNHKQQLEDYINDKNYTNVTLIPTLSWETGGDLKITAHIAQIDSTFVVCNGDNITEIDIGEMVRFHRESRSLATIALFPVSDEQVRHFGVAELDGSRIVRFVEKPADHTIAGNQVNAGYYVLEPQILEMIPYGRAKLEETVFPKVAKAGKAFGYLADLPYWIDIGTMSAYLEANKMVLRRQGLIPPEE